MTNDNLRQKQSVSLQWTDQVGRIWSLAKIQGYAISGEEKKIVSLSAQMRKKARAVRAYITKEVGETYAAKLNLFLMDHHQRYWYKSKEE